MLVAEPEPEPERGAPSASNAGILSPPEQPRRQMCGR